MLSIPKNTCNPLIPELLIWVFEFLSPRDTLSATLVCKNWSELAVPTLWRVHQVRFIDVVKLLGLRRESPRPLSPGSCRPAFLPPFSTVQDHVTRSQWDRFTCFSRYIQALDVGDDWSECELMEALSTLQSKYGGHLFSNIRALSTADLWHSKEAITILSSFFSLCLKSFVMTLSDSGGTPDAEYCDKFLRVLERQSPSVEEIAVCYFGPIQFSSFDSFAGLVTLKLSGDSLTLHALQSIFRCTKLRVLSLTDFDILDESWESTYKDIEKSIINSRHPPSMSIPSINLSLPQVEELELGLDQDMETEAEWQLMLDRAQIWNHVVCPVLRHIIIHELGTKDLRWIDRIAYQGPQVTQITFKAWGSPDPQMLRWFETFKNLRHITIIESDWSGSLGAYIDVHPMLDLWLSAMSQLEVFEWLFEDMDRVGSGTIARRDFVDLTTLPILIRGCTRLRRLSLPFDANMFRPQLKAMTLDSEGLLLDAEQPTSLVHLKVILFNLEQDDLEDFSRAIVKHLHRDAELTVLVRPIKDGYRWSFAGEKKDFERNGTMEDECRELTKRLRREKEERRA